jgi:aspartyl-tRNA synthetase
MSDRIFIKDIPAHVGEEIMLSGWVHARRDHGKIIFIDLRDWSGLVQVVIIPKVLGESSITLETSLKIKALIKARPASMANAETPNGMVEAEALEITVLGNAGATPIPVDGDGYDINEEMRMKYRYLDLRRPRMQNNLRLRHKVTTLVRDYLNKENFVEIETPTLTKSSPEGARDFLVPSRLQPGKFYALPQSPQQYKQLLMIAGMDRYYQIAHCMRDEDLRGERQLEHTQIDMEMSFMKEQEVRDLVEGMMIHVAESCGKKVMKKPFPVFTHEEAMKQFGADKFDLREDKTDNDTMAFAWVIDFPLFEKDEETGRITFAHNPFSAPKEEAIEKLMKGEDLMSLRAQQYDLICNGHELSSGGVRISSPDIQRKVFEIMGLTPEQTEERFGHLIHAYEYGAPPHAGIAPGLDRLVMLLAGEKNIREVIAFPVSAGGQTAVMDAPSAVDPKQLSELGLELKKKA